MSIEQELGDLLLDLEDTVMKPEQSATKLPQFLASQMGRQLGLTRSQRLDALNEIYYQFPVLVPYFDPKQNVVVSSMTVTSTKAICWPALQTLKRWMFEATDNEEIRPGAAEALIALAMGKTHMPPTDKARWSKAPVRPPPPPTWEEMEAMDEDFNMAFFGDPDPLDSTGMGGWESEDDDAEPF